MYETRVQASAVDLAGVRQASNKFYAALDRVFAGDATPMLDVWSHAADVTQMGPFGGRRVGWDAVQDEFEAAARLTRGGHVEARDLLIRVSGDLAYTLCTEHGENLGKQGQHIAVHHRATSIYRREGGEWKLVHHHTDLAPALVELAGGRI